LTSHAVTTTDEDALAGNPACLFGGEKDGDVGDIVGIPDATEWDIACHLRFRFRW